MAGTNRGRVAVVTGGSAGVGRATVRTLATRGYDVAILARGQAGLLAAEADVRACGRRAIGMQCDVADHGAVDSAAERVERELGEIDVWVNNAFVGALAFFWDTTPEEYRRITEVTYIGQVNGTRAALRHMRKRNRGVIINVGSAMCFRSIPLQSAYCGAKHAIKGFTESVRTELEHDQSSVRICLVQLPGLNTPQFDWNLNRMPGHPMPVPPIFQPELPARAIAFLADHPRRNMWIGISTAYTILGERLAPWLADHLLARSGVADQQIDADLPRHGANLFEARDAQADRGAHGPFDDRAHASDPLLWCSMHRVALAWAALACGVAVACGAGAASKASTRSLGGRAARRTRPHPMVGLGR